MRKNNTAGEEVINLEKRIDKLEIELQRVSHAQKMLRECNRVIIQAKDEKVLLKKICKIVVSVGGYRLAWVGFPESGTTKKVVPVAQVGYDDGYLENQNIRWDDTKWGSGPTGLAIRTGKTQIAKDISADPNYAPWRKDAITRGYTHSASIPIKIKRSVIGTLNIYSSETEAFCKDEVALLENWVSDVAYGVQNLRERIERVNVETALKKSEEKYRKFFEDDLTGDFISAIDGTLLACNPAYLRIFGFKSEKEALKYNVNLLYPNAEVRKKLLSELSVKKKLENYEIDLRSKDGKPIQVIENIVGHYDKSGNLIEIKGYVLDVTESKRIEKQLYLSQKLEAVGRLAGGVAHDFNNLLSVIMGYSNFVLKIVQGAEPASKYVEEIVKAAERAGSLTRQLLAFSRKQILQPKIVNLNDIVHDMEKMLRRLIGEDIILDSKLNDDVKQVKADPGQMEQVLMNLAVNARDAMPTGGRLTIETSNVYLDEIYAQKHQPVLTGHYVMFAMSDTGTGMDEDTKSQIFEPFFSTKEKGKGTGLGMSTVYGIIKQSGGYIWIYSELGHGTTIKIYLPQVDQAPFKVKRNRFDPKSFRGTETILLVEDDKMVRDMAFITLEKYGYTVYSASNGEDALNLVNTLKADFDLLLTDVVMPGMSGRELAKKIEPLFDNIKILFMSGFTDDAIVQHGVLDADLQFFQKPFSPTDLARRVRGLLDAKDLGKD